MQLGLLLVATLFSSVAHAQESVFTTLSPEELAEYQFDDSEISFEVSDINLGQRAIMERKRRQIRDLMQRHLGSDRLRGDDADLVRFQQLIDDQRIRSSDVSTWQALGIAFGDLLVARHGLQWVVYEDEYGASKALRWRETDNFVFPVTLFSKRVQFEEAIDVMNLYAELSQTITSFEARPEPLQMP